jgi:ribulose-5-phosphate 4-epimerase/fuculose-1-phosphate aldolase
MNSENNLCFLANALATRVDHIQGAGGNISIKQEGIMWIKASGFLFSEIEKKEGWVALNNEPVADFFRNTHLPRDTGESESLQVIGAAKVHAASELKPSMETGFHAVLGAAVIHTHSVYANVLNCRKNTEEVFADIQKQLPADSAFLKYYSPGYELSKAVAQIKDPPPILFLQNHGIIVHTDSAEEALDILNQTDVVLKHYFELPEWEVQENVLVGEELFSEYVFPDQVVYFPHGSHRQDMPLSRGQIEIAAAYSYVRSGIISSGGNAQTLPELEVQYIANMEMEKHRKQLNKLV